MPLSCYSVDQITGISFSSYSQPSLEDLDSGQFVALRKALRSELFAVSGMLSVQRIAALEIVAANVVQKEISYQIRFVLLPGEN